MLMEQYRAARDSSGLPSRHGAGDPVIGTLRHVFVADTDSEAQAIARRAWAAYHGHYVRRGWTAGSGPVTSSSGAQAPGGGGPSLGGDFDLACRVEACVAGSPETIGRYLARFAGEGMPNYVVGAFQWGDLTHAEAMRSLELFAAATRKSG
jgi:alkanesulfonate monooxygenase SsuD/methylene tetrahydromethanopterin reductase-like flavin-dependent oxidoreductase (luciferase family)